MAEADAMGPDPGVGSEDDQRIDALIGRAGAAWPESDGELDAWLAQHALPPEDEAWLREVIQRRLRETVHLPGTGLDGVAVGGPIPDVSASQPGKGGKGGKGAPPSSATKPAPQATREPEPARRPRRARPLSYEDLALLNGELLEMVEARIPLPTGLRTYTSDLRSGRLEDLLEGLRCDLEAGQPLSAAMSRQGASLPPIYKALVAAGEASGDLAGCLGILHDQAQADVESQRRVRDALAYPALTLIIAAGVLGTMAAYVGPHFQSIFDSMGVELPGATEIILGLSTLINGYPLLCLAVVVGGALGLRQLFRRVWPDWLARFLEGPQRHRSLAELARALAGFLQRSVPLSVAMEALADASPRLSAATLRGVQERLEGGANLAAALRSDPTFPPTFVWLVGAAEQRGDLPAALLALATRHERAFQRRLKLLETAVGPALLGLVGLVVGGYALGLFLPIFELQKSLGS